MLTTAMEEAHIRQQIHFTLIPQHYYKYNFLST